MNPKISIITVVRNSEKTLAQTMLSVLNQTYSSIEYIVIDGASTDGTVDIIKDYDARIKTGEFTNVDFRWISEPDKGIYDAMNKGIDWATGEWINFMNAGDYFIGFSVIEKFVELYDTTSAVVYGDAQLVFNDGIYLQKGTSLSEKNYMPVCHQAFFVKTALLQKIYFDTKYKICADRCFFYKVNRLNYKFQYLPLVICRYDAIDGFSATAPIKMLLEIGDIEGINKTLKWKVFIEIFKIKRVIKYVLPRRFHKKNYGENIQRIY